MFNPGAGAQWENACSEGLRKGRRTREAIKWLALMCAFLLVDSASHVRQMSESY